MWAVCMSWDKGRALLCWIAAALFAALGIAGGSALYLRFLNGTENLLAVYVLNAAQQVFTFALPALMILHARPGRWQRFRQRCALPHWHTLCFGALLAVTATVVISMVAGMWSVFLEKAVGYTAEAQTLPKATNFGQWVLAVLAVAVIPALCEELFFRGLLQSLLCVRLPRGGVWIAALLFGAAHFRWEAFPALVLLGVVLGAGYNRHGYWGSALLHALYNAAVLVLSACELQISVITMVLFVAAFCFVLRGYLEKEEPDETDSSGL